MKFFIKVFFSKSDQNPQFPEQYHKKCWCVHDLLKSILKIYFLRLNHVQGQYSNICLAQIIKYLKIPYVAWRINLTWRVTSLF